MKQVIKFQMSEDKTYLSEDSAFYDIPAGIFNKNETGCGATTIILENGFNYIIAVPTCNLIINKHAKYKDQILPVMGNGRNTPEYINAYLNNPAVKVKKIMVTYDSLKKVIDVIGSDRMKDFQIAIDEFHNIIKAYGYRSSAILNMEDAIQPYINEVRFISATPIPEDFIPSYMKDVNRYDVEWSGSRTVSVECVYSPKPLQKVGSIISDFKKGDVPTILQPDGTLIKSNEAFFFVNCVDDILTVIRSLKLSPEEVRIVCSDNDKNANKVPVKYGISKVLDKNTQLKEIENGKRFTFITSTAFEGVDFFSPTAVTYIVSNIGKKSTVLDISGDIKQIVGRVRDDRETYGVNPFRFKCYHIHNSGVIEGGKEMFEAEMHKNKLIADQQILSYNTQPEYRETIRTTISERLSMYTDKGVNYYCIRINEEGVPVYDDMKEKSLRFRNEYIYNAYATGFSVRAEHGKAGRNVTASEFDGTSFDCPTITPLEKETSLKDRLDQYKGLLHFGDADLWALKTFESDPKNKTLILAYKFMGESKIKALQYREGAVKKALNSTIASLSILPNDVYRTFQIGERYSKADIKYRMKILYDKHCIPGTPKASDLELYFNVTTCNMQDRSKGFEIISKHTTAQKQAEKLRLVIEQLGGLD